MDRRQFLVKFTLGLFGLWQVGMDVWANRARKKRATPPAPVQPVESIRYVNVQCTFVCNGRMTIWLKIREGSRLIDVLNELAQTEFGADEPAWQDAGIILVDVNNEPGQEGYAVKEGDHVIIMPPEYASTDMKSFFMRRIAG